MHTLRHTTSRDTDRIMEIVEGARAFLKSQGLDQWQKGYPDRAIFASDAQTGLGYVLEEDGQIQAVCAVTFTEDPSYVNIYGGRWLTGDADKNGDPPAYAAIHRMAVDPALRGQGTAGKLFACVFSLAKKEGMGSIRIDTHEGNLPMQRALVKAGFTRCGTIRLCGGDEDGDPRIAFEKLL